MPIAKSAAVSDSSGSVVQVRHMRGHRGWWRGRHHMRRRGWR
jgi:hypothetical protein